MRNAIKYICIFMTFIALIFVIPRATAQDHAHGLADTPWPMYQHDPQHTGRSPLLGPVQKPELLWTVQLPLYSGDSGKISIAKDSNLLIVTDSYLYKFDPITRKILWQSEWCCVSESVPLVSDDDFIYWGFADAFAKIASDGSTNWMFELGVYGFNSSATFGADGNLYFIHEGLWSFSPEGNLRWYIYYGNPFSGGSPAIGLDGNIYAGNAITTDDICAYTSSGDIHWCADSPGNATDNSVAVGQDGTIYLPTDGNDIPPYNDAGVVNAIDPSGTVKWTFQPDETDIWYISDGIAIAPDNSIYFGLNTRATENYLYSITPGGQFEWQVALPVNPITTITAQFYHPITVDRAGNAYFCPENSRCYAVSPDGTLLWEFEFPLTDSIIIAAGSQPILAQDGLFYLVDYKSKLYAFADPTQFPFLRTPDESIDYTLEYGTPAFTSTIPLTSTVAPISFTTSVSPSVEWLSIAQPSGVTPSSVDVQINAASLSAGLYITAVTLDPVDPMEKEVVIPVSIKVKHDNTSLKFYIPNINNMGQSDRILFISSWFVDNQLASINYDGTDRRVIAHNIPAQIDMLAYSPDGRKVAFVPYINGKHEIDIMDTQTGETLLTIAEQAEVYFPAWSPDSRRIAYISHKDDPYYGEVYAINLDGTGLQRLTNDSLDEDQLFWSPDGKTIAVGTRSTSVYLMNRDGSDFHQVATMNFRNEIQGWSPDGKYLLLVSRQNHDTDPYRLGKYSIETGNYIFLADNLSGAAKWSSDGSHIAYVAHEPDSPYDKDIFVIDMNGNNQQNLTHELYNEEIDPNWSSNSQWIVFSGRNDDEYEDPNFDIFVVKVDGSGIKQITKNIQVDNHPFWVPQY